MRPESSDVDPGDRVRSRHCELPVARVERVVLDVAVVEIVSTNTSSSFFTGRTGQDPHDFSLRRISAAQWLKRGATTFSTLGQVPGNLVGE